MGKHTPFYELHCFAQAKMVDFSGWDMPLHYGSQIKEHHQVRQAAGLFDVSHMGVIDISGPDVAPYLKHLLANNIERLVEGKALYTCMLNEQGGVLDDLIVYKVAADFYRVVVNAGTREKDFAWMQKEAAHFSVQLKERKDLAMLALQGPASSEKILSLFDKTDAPMLHALKPFHFVRIGDYFIARTGYTGEEGYEIIFPTIKASATWEALLNAGALPCGLGARDTLRLEAGLNLYGQDMDESVTPLESNLTWTVAMEPAERNFMGRAAVARQLEAGSLRCLVGLVLEGAGIIRHHQQVFYENQVVGQVTSGGYAPTLEKSIALARVPAMMGTSCFVEIRDKLVPATVIKPPFVRCGKKMF